MTEEYVILYSNSRIFCLGKKGLMEEINYMLERSNVPFAVLTEEQWKMQESGKLDPLG